MDYFETAGFTTGGVGPRDIGLLESAVARQITGYGGQIKWDTQYEVVSTLFYGLIKNHPFHDANKRTALLTCLVHLSKCGKCLRLDDKHLEDFTVDVAESRIDHYKATHRKGISESKSDEEVRIIAKWLRRNLRNIDDEYREISYETLRQIMNGHDFDLQDPKGNYINVTKRKVKRSIFRLWPVIDDYERVGRIGFHSWKSTVPRSETKKIREMTSLTKANGYDAAAFYGWEDPIRYLIGQYETPLRNLADR